MTACGVPDMLRLPEQLPQREEAAQLHASQEESVMKCGGEDLRSRINSRKGVSYAFWYLRGNTMSAGEAPL
jgi:hypothetical protein